MIRLGYIQESMFWRTKTATQHQSEQAVVADGKLPIQENFVLEAANVDTDRRQPPQVTPRSVLPDLSQAGRAYVVPRSYRVTGTIISARPVVVQGEVADGAMDAAVVSVPHGGRLAVPTKASSVYVDGLVVSDVSASVEIAVGSQATVRGSLNAPAIRVEPGAQLANAVLFVGPKR